MWGLQIIPEAVFAFQALQKPWKEQVGYHLLRYFVAVVASYTARWRFYADNLTWNTHKGIFEEHPIQLSLFILLSGLLECCSCLGKKLGFRPGLVASSSQGHTERQTTIPTKFRVASQPNVLVFGLLVDIVVPGETHADTEGESSPY